MANESQPFNPSSSSEPASVPAGKRSISSRDRSKFLLSILHYLEFEIQIPGRKHPRPTPFVFLRIPVRQPPDDLIDQRRNKHQLCAQPAESIPAIEREFIFPGEIVKAEPTEIVAVGRIGKGISAGEVRDSDLDY